MHEYKTGETCPFCGKPITTTDPELLGLISKAADYLNLPEPDASFVKFMCMIHNCPRVKAAGALCCQSCDARLSCPNVCYNRPDRCGCARELTDEETDKL